jgi:hypothetical protein
MVGAVQKSNVILLAENRTSRAFKQAGSDADKLQKKYTGISLATAGITTAAAALAAGFLVLTKNAIDNAAALGDVSDKIGLGVEALQEYRFAADQAGVSQQTLDLALQRASRRIGEAAQGTGELKDTLLQYDIAVRDAEGRQRALTDVLDDYADAIQNAESDQERLRLAFKAFDSEGAALVNLFRDGSEGIETMRQEARNLGLVLDESMVRQAGRANDALDRMRDILGTSLQRVLISLAPTVEQIGIAFAEAAPAIVDAANALVKFFGGVELLGLEALNRELEALQERARVLQEEEDRFGKQRIKDGGVRNKQAIDGVNAEIAAVERLIETRKKELEVRGDLFASSGGRPPGADDQKVLDAQKRLLDGLQEARLRALDDEEALIQLRLARKIQEIDELEFAEDVARQAKHDAEVNAELELQEVRRAAREQEEEEREEHLNVLERQTENAAERMRELWAAGLDGQLQVTGSILGQLGRLMDSESKKAFKIGKAAAIAQALIDTYAAANAAYKALAGIPVVGPALAAAAAAAAIAAGLANVSRIKSQSFSGGGSSGGGGGGGGGGSSRGSVAAEPVPDLSDLAEPVARTINLTIESDNGMVSLDWVENTLFPVMNEALRDGTVLNVTPS